jgi:ABC-type iron transport system FetAB ATPase subunit
LSGPGAFQSSYIVKGCKGRVEEGLWWSQRIFNGIGRSMVPNIVAEVLSKDGGFLRFEGRRLSMDILRCLP